MGSSIVDNSGPELIVADPPGSAPCDTSAGPVVCPVDQCCNFFKLDLEGRGSSFIFSAGGPFRVTQPLCDTFACPSGLAPSVLPAAIPGFVDPGPLAGVVCMGLTPGSYLIHATVSMQNASPGARVAVVYYPDCTDPSLFYTITECSAPCPDFNCLQGVKTFNSRDLACLDCCCQLAVPNPGCNPGFQLLAINGCAQTGLGLTPDPAQVLSFLENFQIVATRLSGRDIVNCGGNPLLSGDAHFTDCQVFECPGV